MNGDNLIIGQNNSETIPTKLSLAAAGDGDGALEVETNLGDGIEASTGGGLAASAVRAVNAGRGGFNNAEVGVFGQADRGLAGIRGVSLSGAGCLGQSQRGYGTSGESDSNAGIRGRSTSGAGCFGQSESGDGVVGESLNRWGVQGVAHRSGVGTVGISYRGNGVYGQAYIGFGVRGHSTTSVGVRGYSASVDEGGDPTPNGVGVYGESPWGVGVHGVTVDRPDGGLAGRFDGPVVVNGALTVLGGITFAVVRHPDGSHRRLYSVESPESWFEDFGTAKLRRGNAEVKLDRDFAALVRRNDYHVFLTPLGDSLGLYVKGKGPSSFEVREQQGGTSSLAFSYRVVAKRKDIKGSRLEKVKLPKARRVAEVKPLLTTKELRVGLTPPERPRSPKTRKPKPKRRKTHKR
jgi:hypothetical protein